MQEEPARPINKQDEFKAGALLGFGLWVVLGLPLQLALLFAFDVTPGSWRDWHWPKVALANPGVAQLLYMIPAAIWLHRKGERGARSGLIAVTALGTLLSVPCFGLLLS